MDPELVALRARALIALAVPRFESHGLQAALALLDRARAEAEQTGARQLVVLSQVQQAGLQARSGRWADSIAAINEVDAELVVLSGRERAVAYLNRGLAKQYVNDFSGSRADLQQALSVAGEGGSADVAAMARHNLGCLALLQGDVPAALGLMSQGLDDTGIALSSTLLDLGRTHIEAGLLDEARALLWRGLHIATGDQRHHTRGELLIELAREALISSELTNAARYSREAGRIFERFSAAAWRQQANVMGAQASLLAGDLLAFQTLSDQVARHRSESPALRHDAALVAAERALQDDDLRLADRRLDEARRSGRVILTSRLHRDLLDATIGHRAGQPDRRRRALHRASARLVKASASYSGMDARTALALHGWRLAELDLDVALASGRPASAYAATERWRSLSSRLPRLRPIADERLSELAAELRHVHAQMDDLDDISDDAELRLEASRLERQIAHRERALSGESPGVSGVAPPLAYPVARRMLADSGTSATAFFTHRGRLRALSMAHGRSRIHDLADDVDIRTLSRRLTADLRVLSHAPAPLRPVVEASIAREVARLDALLGPALRHGTDRTVIVPSRVLPSVPWRMLPSLRGAAVVVSPSLSAWGRPSTPGAGGVSAISGPGVPRAETEVEAVIDAWASGTAYVQSEATTARLSTLLAECEVLHVAAHGVHHDESPLFSFIQMADGPAFAYEFQQVAVAAQHVVLSSCDAGQSHFRIGDEALGLTASLLDCGVRSVVAAVAPVLDSSAAPLMAAYHRELARGHDAATALEVASEGIPDARLFTTYGTSWQRQVK